MPNANGALAEPYDPDRAGETILAWLDRWGLDALPHEPIPPIGEAEIEAARTEAERAAQASGRLDALRDLRRTIIDWAMGQYRQAGLSAVYFTGALEPPDQRRTAIEVLLDAATAYFLADVIRDDTAAALLARFDVYLGGPIFRSAPEEG
ncbi:MAG: hypothetical protein WEE50_03710 [Chloroflexota bacterium]